MQWRINPVIRKATIVAFISTLLAACQSSAPDNPIRSADFVDLERFMGDWYVIANIPTFLERDAYNAVERYELDEDGNIPTDMPKEARELANFLALLIDDASMGDYDADEATIGLVYGDAGITANVWAPTAQNVELMVYNQAKELQDTVARHSCQIIKEKVNK